MCTLHKTYIGIPLCIINSTDYHMPSRCQKIQEKNLSAKPLGYCFLVLIYSYMYFKVKCFRLGIFWRTLLDQNPTVYWSGFFM